MPLFLNTRPRRPITGKLTVLLAGCLLLAGCGRAPSSGSAATIQPKPNSQRRTVAYDQMEIGEANGPELAQKLRDLAGQVDSMESLDQLLEAEEALNSELEVFSTSSSLAQLESYLHSSDENARQRSQEFSVQGEEVSQAVSDYLRAVMDSHLAEAYRADAGTYVAAQMDKQLASSDPAALEPLQRRAELDSEYNQLLSNLRVEVNGEERRMEEVLNDPDISMEDFYTAIGDYYLGNYQQFADIYLEMITLDKQAAAACGYDDAAQWRYDWYGRDYTPDDAREMFEEIKTWVVPLLAENASSSAMSQPLSLEEGVDAVETLLADTDSRLAEGWDFLTEYGLYSLEPAPDKQSGIGFTTSLAAYDAPFIYTYWGDTLDDAFTLIHEFGHAMDDYTQFGNEAYSTDLDKCETFSQGLEQVLRDRLANQLGADAEGVRVAMQSNMLQVITYQAALEEFQLEAYELDENADAEDLGSLYSQVLAEYGYYTIFGEMDPSWFEITHLFDSPFYTVSYVTSATAALELGRMEDEEEGAGLEAWLQLLRTDRNQSFESFLQSAGIASPFEKGRIRECAEFLESQLSGGGMEYAA